jgi:1-acyl-sn-glycerol-3-phosphate acyltransferase
VLRDLPRKGCREIAFRGTRNGFYVCPAVFHESIASLLAALVKVLAGNSVRWLGCRPDTRQRIYFANHTSHLDALVLWAALPPEARLLTRPVAAHDYWTADPLRRYLATRVFRAVLIEREHVSAHAHNPIAQMLTALADGRSSLVIFPEGTRGSGPEAGPFKGGLYHLGKHRPDIELVPVHIDNLNRILPKGELLPVPLLSAASFGVPLHIGADEPKADFLARARAAVNGLR